MALKKLHDWMPEESDSKYAQAWELANYIPDVRSESRVSTSNLFDFGKANLIKVFGENWHEQWSKITARRLIEWNVNTVGNWSDMDFARKSKTPYVMPMEGFPVTKLRIFRDFPDVFSKEYKALSTEFAQQLKATKEDKYLIGYFMNNEPGWAYIPEINLAEEVLSKGDGFATKAKLIEYLTTKYQGQIDGLNSAWKTTFSDFSELNTPIRRRLKIIGKGSGRSAVVFGKNARRVYSSAS